MIKDQLINVRNGLIQTFVARDIEYTEPDMTSQFRGAQCMQCDSPNVDETGRHGHSDGCLIPALNGIIDSLDAGGRGHDELSALIAAASPLPWHWEQPDDPMLFDATVASPEPGKYASGTAIIQTDMEVYGPTPDDRAYIEAACNALPALIAECEALESQLGQVHADFFGLQDGALVRDLQAHVARLEAERDRLREALGPFDDFGEYLEVETAGFADDDELDLSINDHLLFHFKAGDFRKARAALAQTAVVEPCPLHGCDMTDGRCPECGELAKQMHENTQGQADG